ncbi:hypothetical protein FRX31_019882 [Thalictrum thalictroides]|uniref:Tesmin/TSO1-like CXC domain-containing protein n=1 Tax=Thalictrum thalictroides TaxID=46969 RepID=A0A7J6W197_THATH|nr:hypothetical protein FRX31_019882 [Thalictrum thalictroides]
MDISDSDKDWVPSDHETDLESGLLLKKRSSRTSALIASHQTDCEDLKSEAIIEEATCSNVKAASTACCSCSRRSYCKTKNCVCRAAGGTCGASCACVPSKCSNRESGSNMTDVDVSVISEENCINTADIEKDKILASQGAMLLQSALAEKPSNVKNEGNETRRRPLSDIGNNTQVPF